MLVCFWWRLIQMEDRGLNKDIELVNPLRSWTLKTWNTQNNKKRKFCGKVARQSITNYASNFEEVVGAYWFQVVRASVCPSMGPFVTRFDACHVLWTVHARVLKFHVWFYMKKGWPIFVYLSELSPFFESCSFEKTRMNSCLQDISQSIWPRSLKLGQLIEDDAWIIGLTCEQIQLCFLSFHSDET